MNRFLALVKDKEAADQARSDMQFVRGQGRRGGRGEGRQHPPLDRLREAQGCRGSLHEERLRRGPHPLRHPRQGLLPRHRGGRRGSLPRAAEKPRREHPEGRRSRTEGREGFLALRPRPGRGVDGRDVSRGQTIRRSRRISRPVGVPLRKGQGRLRGSSGSRAAERWARASCSSASATSAAVPWPSASPERSSATASGPKAPGSRPGRTRPRPGKPSWS